MPGLQHGLNSNVMISECSNWGSLPGEEIILPVSQISGASAYGHHICPMLEETSSGCVFNLESYTGDTNIYI